MASPTLIGGGAARRIEFFPTVALPYAGEKGDGERWRGFPSLSHMRSAARAEACAERSDAMRSYKCDPHWITVKFKGNTCVRCKRPINAGERAFY